ncbi:MAG: hypothetical protein ACRD4B_01395 [Acidobacteriota bacterium]
MTESENPANPHNFPSFVRHRFSEEVYKSLEKEGQALDGRFRGEMARFIAQWQVEGLGRIVSIPLLTANSFEYAEERSGNQEVMYALPYTENVTKAVVLFPSKERNQLCIINPQTPDALDTFRTFFAPSPNPSVHDQWRPDPYQTPYDAFVANPAAFSAKIAMYTSVTQGNETLNLALTIARERKRRGL